jgi:hypothetical protein
MPIIGEIGMRAKPTLALIATAGLFLLSSCGKPVSDTSVNEPLRPAWFADVTEQCGLKFVHDAGPTGSYFFPQIMGSGGALLDYDNDGRLDLYLIQNAGPEAASKNQLYHQEADGTFKNVSEGSGLDVAGYGMGAAVGDVNNDGLVDVFLTEYGRSRLFLNTGQGKFRDVTAAAGIDNPLWGTSAAFLDFDRDGWLDLVIVNYVLYDKSISCTSARGRKGFCHPSTFRGSISKLYRNQGKSLVASQAVAFSDVTVSSGLGRQSGPGLGVLCADFDGDGWVDIFIANDSKPNHLWMNQRDGTFQEDAVGRGLAANRMGQPEANMGVALGDVDSDGLFDIFVTHLTEETHTFWKQSPRGLFQDRTVAAGLASPLWRGTGFGTVLADFDHDGALDAAIVNGRVSEPRTDIPPETERDFWNIYRERNQLFSSNGQGVFSDIAVSNPAFSEQPGVHRGLLCGDLDNDGALDLVVTAIAGSARVFRNKAPQRGHWLMVRAIDPALRRDAIGTEITVVVEGRRLWRQANPGFGYLCSNDPRAHFGLGKAPSLESITVRWPDGSSEAFAGGAADRTVTLRRGEGRQP